MKNGGGKERGYRMTLEEFRKLGKEDEEWAPGWEAIEDAFGKVYADPDCTSDHYATKLLARVEFGGQDYLDGYTIYTSKKGYKHIVTFGMTELYFDEEAFGGEWSKWGYEMTIKLAETENEKCMWAIGLLGNLARYTYQQEKFFQPFQYVSFGGASICAERESALTGLLIVNDTEVEGVDTVYGRTDFMQLVGITQKELEAIIENPELGKVLVERMKKDNPDLVTDLNRTKSYL